MLVEDAAMGMRAEWEWEWEMLGLWILVFPSSGGEFDPVDRVLDAAAPRRPREDRAVLEARHDVQGRGGRESSVLAERAAYMQGGLRVVRRRRRRRRRHYLQLGERAAIRNRLRVLVLVLVFVDVARLDRLTGREADRFEIGSDLLDGDDTVPLRKKDDGWLCDPESREMSVN